MKLWFALSQWFFTLLLKKWTPPASMAYFSHLRGCRISGSSWMDSADINKHRTLSWSNITGLWYRNQGPYEGQADWDGVSVRLKMTALKQCLFFMGMGMPGCDDVLGCCGCTVSLLPGQWLMHDYGPQGNPRSSTTFGGERCYKVSPSHTHKQDTITDTQCGCPFVWFIGDVVANVASVSFRGSGRLQIFPSQQEVQIWKKENKGSREASLFQKEAGHQKEQSNSWQMRTVCSTKGPPPDIHEGQEYYPI